MPDGMILPLSPKDIFVFRIIRAGLLFGILESESLSNKRSTHIFFLPSLQKIFTMQKNAVVTGGTKGIGREISKQLAQKGYSVLLIGRDSQAGESVTTDIAQQYPESSAAYLEGDLGEIDSTREVIQGIKHHFSRIDVLVNNAGIWPTSLMLNRSGIEMGFMVNHLAVLLLIQGLLPELTVAAPSRIVNVNAGLYIKGKVDLTQTPYGKDFHKINTYANTKLCNTLMTLELAERLPKDLITINALHPGVIRTELGSFRGPLGWLLSCVKLFWASPEKGAEPPVWLATHPDVQGISGTYYNKTEEMELADNAKDEKLRKVLWEKSLELVDLGEAAFRV